MKNRLIKIVVGACFILALGVAITSFICNDDFWKVNAAQALTLIVTICIAFWATQLKNDERKKKEHAEQLLRKIQTTVADEQFYSISSSCDVVEHKKRVTMSNRSLSNSIEMLKKYAETLGFKEGAEYIAKEFKEYKEFVSEHLEDVDYLSKSESTLKKHSENIYTKCDWIILELY